MALAVYIRPGPSVADAAAGAGKGAPASDTRRLPCATGCRSDDGAPDPVPTKEERPAVTVAVFLYVLHARARTRRASVRVDVAAHVSHM